MITAGVIGWPVAHSRSPLIHGYWLNLHGIAGRYLRMPVKSENLAGFIAGMAAKGIAGVNVTIPHKERVFELVTEQKRAAARLHAVNTLYFEDGRLVGDNTDGYGFITSLTEAVPDWTATAGPAVVLGAGGAARAVVAALDDAGSPDIVIVNRSLDRARQVAADLRPDARLVPWPEAAEAIGHAALVVNATSLGMSGMPPLDLDLGRLPAAAVVADIVYTPLRTSLLQGAAARGNRTVDGLGMLLHQARPGFHRWFGIEPRVTPQLRALVERDIEAAR